jgi:hypothetical protein
MKLTVPLALLAVAAALLTPAARADPPARASARLPVPAKFVHPGVLVSRSQLSFVRSKVRRGEPPWSAAFAQMMSSKYADQTRLPKPRPVVECGSYSRPNHGCTDEREDAIAAYTNALSWYITRDDRYAKKAIELMNAWSAVIEDHTNSNAPLQAGWAGSVWPRAAEIIRHTYRKWGRSRRFARMLRQVYLPEVVRGSNRNGNWDLTMLEAAIGISVFLESRSVYRTTIRRLLRRVPAYIYVRSDGRRPRTMPKSGRNAHREVVEYWHGQSRMSRGLTQETCRDLTHTGYGLSAISHIAETSRIQRRSLYPRVGRRLRHALGFQSRYELGAAAPGWLCGGTLDLGLGPVTEVGFNALHHRLGHAMSNTQRLTERQRPAGTNNLFVAWETLTHAANPR